MEKHKTCKLCSRKFANGRALGGHMRSHMMNLYIQQQQQQQQQQQISEETESIPSSSWSSEEENGEKCKILNLSDLSGEEAADDSVVLPDKESETESSKNRTRSRRSKRVRKSSIVNPNFVKVTEYYSSLVETEPVSSISETSPEEDVAHCLMMLSKDKWIKEQVDHYSDEEEEYKEENSGVQVKVITKNRRGRGKYRCETCNKNFRSYQALGGHRASHKKIKVSSYNNEVVENVGVIEEKIHECPVCYRVFSSGQALGGHKRSHVIGVSTAAAANISVPVFIPTAAKLEFSRNGGSLIDLNLPPPMEELDDEIISQVEVSAVSDDAEFVNPIKH